MSHETSCRRHPTALGGSPRSVPWAVLLSLGATVTAAADGLEPAAPDELFAAELPYLEQPGELQTTAWTRRGSGPAAATWTAEEDGTRSTPGLVWHASRLGDPGLGLEVDLGGDEDRRALVVRVARPRGEGR
jgi:hypothetical protein